VRNRHLRAARDKLARDPHSAHLSSEQPVAVFPAYRDSYFKPGIEESVFSLLDELADRTPFCDVVMTGHSYGSALATLAGVRYASSRSQIRVCCNVFGSPKVGGVEFRHWANSLPNLKVMRVEYGSDPWVVAPEGNAWSHIGHSIIIDCGVTTVCEKDFKMESLHPKLGDHAKKEVEEKKVPVIARAYRFDQHRPLSSAGKQFLSTVAKSMTGGHRIASKSEKNDHELSVYVYAVERIASLKIPWISDYVGEDAGEGVVGKDGQDRRMFV
jgi:pimeloyl-ACP methyl ester carboxylesterase